MAGNFFHGTSVDQDGRWGKVDQKMINEMAKEGKLAPILDTKVIMKKVNLDVISKWITQKIIQEIGFEDDILINTVINMLQGENVDPKRMVLNLIAFLDKKAPSFVEELWTLLVDAQNQPSGIPSVLIEKKKEELAAKGKGGNTSAVNIIPFDSSRAQRGRDDGDEREKDKTAEKRKRDASPTFATRNDRRESPEKPRRDRDYTPRRRTREQSPSEPRRRYRDDTPMRSRRTSTPKRTRGGESPSSRRPRDREESSPPRRGSGGHDRGSPSRRRNRSRTPERSSRRTPSPRVLRTEEKRSSRREGDDSPPVRRSNREQTPSRRRPRRDSPPREKDRDREREKDRERDRDRDREREGGRDRKHREDREDDRRRERRSRSREKRPRRDSSPKNDTNPSERSPSPSAPLRTEEEKPKEATESMI